MASSPRAKTVCEPEAPAPAPVVAPSAPAARQFKIGDRVTIKKDGARAVVTDAAIIEGKKQTRIECRREDNGSVYSFWFDEIL